MPLRSNPSRTRQKTRQRKRQRTRQRTRQRRSRIPRLTACKSMQMAATRQFRQILQLQQRQPRMVRQKRPNNPHRLRMELLVLQLIAIQHPRATRRPPLQMTRTMKWRRPMMLRHLSAPEPAFPTLRAQPEPRQSSRTLMDLRSMCASWMVTRKESFGSVCGPSQMQTRAKEKGRARTREKERVRARAKVKVKAKVRARVGERPSGRV
mmetsp:Transcript_119354/g.232238  ORF Transcript_119354/g.232238 Transcript_119354/m.232238 type:complete len:208 (+) Transcript_119354:349-972(+)